MLQGVLGFQVTNCLGSCRSLPCSNRIQCHHIHSLCQPRRASPAGSQNRLGPHTHPPAAPTSTGSVLPVSAVLTMSSLSCCDPLSTTD